MKCNMCSYENKNTNIKCEQCGNVLIDVEKVNNDLEFGNPINDVPVARLKSGSFKKLIIIVLIFFFESPFIIMGVFLFGLGVNFYVLEGKEIENYKEASGVLVDYVDCSNDEKDKLCLGLYEYEIDGVVYSVKNNVSTNPEDLEKKEKVYYDENNPDEAFIKLKFWDTLLGIGLKIIIITLIPIIIVLFIFKKTNKVVDLEEENKPMTI